MKYFGRLRQAFSASEPEKKYLVGALLAVSTSTAGILAFPTLTGRLMDLLGNRNQNDPVIESSWLSRVNQHTGLCAFALVVASSASFLRYYLLETTAERVSRRLRSSFFDQLLQKPVHFFNTNGTGELISRLSVDIKTVSHSVIDSFWGVRTGLNAGIGTILVMKTAPLSVVPQLFTPVALAFIGMLAYGRIVRRLAKKKQDALADAINFANEKLSMIKVVKLFNGEKYDCLRFDKSLDKVYELARKSAVVDAGQVSILSLFGGGFLLHVIYNCGLLISQGVMTLGQTSALAGYLLIAGRGYQGIITAYGDIQKALGASGRVLNLINAEKDESRKDEAVKPLLFTGGPPSVEFRNVSFAYPDNLDYPVLHEVTLMLDGGAKHSIVGHSGCGKSSLLLLLAKLYNPLSGFICLSQQDIAEVDPEKLREFISFVPQESSLFATSVEENVSYPSHLRVDKEILSKMACLRFVKDWNMFVGERGQALSGGEKQRLCIARALNKDVPLLLLDEATSSLDSQTDNEVLTALNEYQNDKTIVAVTHKLSTVVWSDYLTVLDKGKVVQHGKTRELLSKPGQVLDKLLSQIRESNTRTVPR